MQKILFLLVVGILILIPLGELIRLEPIPAVAIRPVDILVGVTAGFFLVLLLLTKRKLHTTAITYPLILFLTVAAVSLVINSIYLNPVQFLIAFLYVIRFLLYAMLFFIVYAFSALRKKIILYLLHFCAIVFLFIGYMQYAFYQNLRNLFYLGWDDHLYRLFSSFLDPNFAGAFLSLFVTLLLGLLLYHMSKHNRKYVYLFLVLLLITTPALVLTYSRSALIMALVSVLILLIRLGKKRWVFFLFFAILLGFLLLSRNFKKENTNLLRTASTAARISSMNEAAQIIQKNPILGVGFNAYRYAQIRYKLRNDKSLIASHSDAGTDNSFLFVFATTGIIGLLAYISLLKHMFVLAKETLQKNKDAILPHISIASLCGLIVASLFNNSLFYPPLLLWLFVLLGIMDYM